MKKSVAIIGAGYAGISSAVFIDHSKYDVTIFESTNHVGGRAFSYFDKEFGYDLDNGQHMLMACYTNTLKLFKILNISDDLFVQKKMRVPYQTKKHSYSFKSLSFLPAPLHLLYSLLFDIKSLSFLDRIKLLIPSLSLFFPLTKSIKETSVGDWLRKKGQSEKAIKYVWEPISIGTMNDDINQISAYTFKKLLQILFIKSRKNANVIFSKVGLSNLLERQFNKFCKHRNIKQIQSSVKKIEQKDDRYLLILPNENAQFFDYIISSVPYFSLEKLLSKPNLFPMRTTSIISIHFKYNAVLFDELFIGLPDSNIHWIFNKEKLNDSYKHIYSCTISAPSESILHQIKKPKEFLRKELSVNFPLFDSQKLTHVKVIHEKRATFSDSIIEKPTRPTPGKYSHNLYLCGDWTDTELPATIESACESAHIMLKDFHS